MCFQGYVHYLCGHTSLYEEECPTATSLELPFFQKISCPAYEISRRTPSRLCGTGTFYCAQTPDGQYLDRVYAALSDVQSDIQTLTHRIYGPGGLREYGQSLGNAVLAAGGSREECQNDEGVRAVWEVVGQLGREVKAQKHREQGMLTTIEKAKRWFDVARERFGNGVKGPSELLMAGGMCPPPLQQRQVRQKPLASLAAGWKMPVGSYRLARASQVQEPTDLSAPQAQGFPKKRGPQKREVSSPEKTTSLLPTRRSSRVRTKKISYVDSDSPDPSSRTPSPAKSEAGDSTFSPSKPEAVPAHRQARVAKSSSSSLVEMIGDWKKGHDNVVPLRPDTMDNATAQSPVGLKNIPVLEATKRVWHGGDREPQKRSLPLLPAEEEEDAANKRTKISFLTQLRSGITDREFSPTKTQASILPPLAMKTVSPVRGEEEEEEEEEDDDETAVVSEGDSTLSEIDWDILEEGVLE